MLLQHLKNEKSYADLVIQGGVGSRLTSRSKYGTKKPKTT